MFESMENLLVANDLRYYENILWYVARLSSKTYREIHRLVLIDTPISTYFNDCLKNEKIDETNIEFIRNSVYKVGTSTVSEEISDPASYKAYLEDFVNFCIQLGDECSDLMVISVGTYAFFF